MFNDLDDAVSNNDDYQDQFSKPKDNNMDFDERSAGTINALNFIIGSWNSQDNHKQKSQRHTIDHLYESEAHHSVKYISLMFIATSFE